MLERLKGSYLAKLVMSHLTLTFLLVTLGGGLLLNKTADMMTTEMKATGEAQLLAMRERLEREQLESYNAALLNKALSTVRVEAESEIQYFLDHGKADSMYRITRFTQDDDAAARPCRAAAHHDGGFHRQHCRALRLPQPAVFRNQIQGTARGYPCSISSGTQ